MEAVFGNDLLLEMILAFVIHGDIVDTCMKNLCSVRLVQKLWLETVSKLVEKSEDHFYIDLYTDTRTDLFDSKSVQENEKVLNRFTSVFTANNHLKISVLLTRVFLNECFFRVENYYSLLNFLRQCGQYLNILIIHFPRDGGSMPVTFPQFSLPNLKSIDFTFQNNRVFPERHKKYHKYFFGDNRNGLAFLQLVLNASKKLKIFEVSFVGRHRTFPQNIEYLKLPDSTTELILGNGLSSELEELVLQNELPSLQDLTLWQENSETGSISMFKVLERVRKKLKTFTFRGRNIRFPEMENLENLTFPASDVTIENSISSLSPQLLPKLKYVNIEEHVESLSHLFDQVGRFTTVKKLELELLTGGDELAFLHSQIMERFDKAFPNLEQLYITVSIDHMTGLNYLFGNMNNLKKLAIHFLGEIDDNAAKQIESVFLGLPKESLNPSLKNLSELESLELYNDCEINNGKISLLSDSIFKFGIMQMVNLRTLLLYDDFKPTTDMQAKWIKQRKIMKYQKY